MKSLEYVKEHYDEFEEDDLLDKRWTKRFLDFLPSEEWGKYGFKIKEGVTHTPIEWTEENILKQLKKDVEFGKEKAEDERGISSELMAMVVNAWCKVLENGLNLDGDDGWYHHRQFDIVAEYYGWQKGEVNRMTKAEAIAMLKRIQEPEAWEPQINQAAFEALDMAIKALEQEPSCRNIRQVDLISRQAAIEYLMTNMNWYDEDGYESDDDYKRECITDLINGVPSAQPEIIRCKDCKHKYLDGMIWNCPFGLSGGEDFFCAYGAKEGDSDDE